MGITKLSNMKMKSVGFDTIKYLVNFFISQNSDQRDKARII